MMFASLETVTLNSSVNLNIFFTCHTFCVHGAHIVLYDKDNSNYVQVLIWRGGF